MRATARLPTAVVRKDLRLRMRGWRWAGVVTLYLGLLAVIVLGFLLQKYRPTVSQSTHAGIELFQTLSIFQLFLIVFITPASMGGAISGERQNRTWELLLASRLSAGAIVWGKLLGGLSFNLLLLLASLPLFAVVFLFGGLAPPAEVPAFVVFLVTVLLLAAMSLTVSSLTARLTVSFMISLLIALTLVIGLSLVILYLQAPGHPGLLTLSSVPFQSGQSTAPLPPIAQMDPLLALLSALPSRSGGPLLGPPGVIHHAFGLPWRLPLWGAYSLIAGMISVVLVLITPRLLRP